MPRRSYYIYALGVLFILTATIQSVLQMTTGGGIVEEAIDFALIAFPGVLLVYVGRWVSSTEFDPELYPRIALWCLGGVGVMFVFVALRAVHPGVAAHFSYGERAIALSIGSVAGLAIGIHEARALTREREAHRANEELKRAQKTLERQNEELERTRADLEEAVRQFEESNEQLEQFAHAASHDLQEPLRMVSSYLRLVEDRYADGLDDDASEFIGFAVDGATRMQTMIDNLLRYSRVDTGGDPFESVDIRAVVDDVLTDLQVRIEETDAEISTGDLPSVEGDASQLRQLFQNLLKNALEYCGDEPPRVRISAEDGGNEWILSVSDDGIGIEPDDRRRIFEIFQRLHAVDGPSGSGIGLALCRRIVERHGGDIWVDSVPGEGSTFSFTVPAGGGTAVRPTAESRRGGQFESGHA